MLCALIMAGGRGTRFWPLSTDEKPKQFLKLIDDKTMIQMTIDRIKPIIPIERIFVCTGEMYIDLVKEQLPNLPEGNIVVEPEGRNTAPCIALSSFVIKRQYPNSNMIVLPADHLIKDEDEFRRLIKFGNEYVKGNNESIITFGMNPNRPETGYGYIKYKNTKGDGKNKSIIKVEKFVEKPNKEKAITYLKEGNYLWNGGMFLWNIKNILKDISKYVPNTYEALKEIANVPLEKLQEEINNKYSYTDNISIDYAVLEKSEDIYVIPSNIGWDDVGSWEAIERYKEKDNEGNISMGNVTYLNSSDNLVVSSNIKEVVIHGLSNIYVIENDGKLIIGTKDEIKRIKELPAIIEGN